MTDLTPWNNPKSYLPNLEDQLGIVEHYEKLARQAVRKANWKRRVRAFCLSVAICSVLYFIGQFVRVFL